MELSKLNGLVTDTRISEAGNGSWVNAVGIVISEKYNSICQEKGFSIHSSFTGNICGLPVISNDDIIICTDDNKIWRQNSNGVELVFQDARLNFSLNHPIEGTFKYLFNKNLISAFTDDFNSIKILNFDCLPFNLDVNKNLINPDDFTLCELFPDIKHSNITDLQQVNSGGNFKSGVVYVSYAYVLKDGSVTDFIYISNPISIVDKLNNDEFTEYDGCEANSFTGKSISFKLFNVDTRYYKIRIVVLTKIGGVLTTKPIDDYLITASAMAFLITGFETPSFEVSLQEVLIPSDNYSHAKTITNFEDTIYLANLRQENNVNLLEVAKNIDIKWTDKEINLESIKNSYKDDNLIYEFKGFQPDEVYAFYLVGFLKKGGLTDAFHIPGRKLEVSDYTILEYPDFENPIKRYQVQNSAKQDGTMGTWQNSNEFYSECYGDLKNHNVRHHKFPSRPQLEDWGKPFIKDLTKGLEVGIYTPFGNNVYQFLGFPYGGGTPYGLSLIETNNLVGASLARSYMFNGAIHYGIPPYQTPYNGTNQIDFSFDSNLYISGKWYIPLFDNGNEVRFKTLVYKKNGSNYTLIHNETTDYDVAAINGFIGYDFTTPILAGESLIFFFIVQIKFGEYPKDKDVNFDYGNSRIEIYKDFPVGQESRTTTRILGINVSNVNIPQDLKDKLNGWGIFYAKRNAEDRLILGQSVLLNNDWHSYDYVNGQFRIHPFDMLYNQIGIKPYYLKPQVKLKSTNYVRIRDTEYNTDDAEEIFVDKNDYRESSLCPLNSYEGIRAIRKFKQLPNNNSATEPSNENREECFYGEFTEHLEVNFYHSQERYVLLTNLYNLKDNIYNSFESRELVYTGTFFDKDETSCIVFGGDTIVSMFGFRQTYMALNGDLQHAGNELENNFPNTTWHYFPVESNANINFRHSELSLETKYYPKNEPPIFNTKKMKLENLSGDSMDYTNKFLYNNDYTSINDLFKAYPFRCENKCNIDETDFPFRVAWSLKSNKEEYELKWRKFLTTNYHEEERKKGEIWVIRNFGTSLLIHHKYALYATDVKNRLLTNNIEIKLGTGDIFENSTIEIAPTEIGLIGNQCQWFSFVCPLGYVSADPLRGRIIIYNGKFQEISAIGMEKFFEANLKTTDVDIDNPFIGKGICGTYDENNRRIIISKIDNEGKSFTLSYTPILNQGNGGWVCFHQYQPSFMFYTRENSFAINKGNIYKMNQNDSVSKYFDGQIFSSSIDFYFKAEKWNEHRVHSVSWISEVLDRITGANTINKTIDAVVIYNNNQCTGLIEVEDLRNKIFTSNSRNRSKQWNLNHIRDMVIDPNIRFIDEDFRLIPINIDTNKSFTKKSFIQDKFTILRLIWANSNQDLIFINDVMINTLPSTIKR